MAKPLFLVAVPDTVSSVDLQELALNLSSKITDYHVLVYRESNNKHLKALFVLIFAHDQ